MQRVDLACRVLEAGERRLDVVARTSGLGTTATLRAQLRHHTGLGPSAYRSRFGTGAASPGTASVTAPPRPEVAGPPAADPLPSPR